MEQDLRSFGIVKEEALQKIEALLKKLGYTMADTIRISYLSALMAKEGY